jgi:hypothetical protein
MTFIPECKRTIGLVVRSLTVPNWLGHLCKRLNDDARFEVSILVDRSGATRRWCWAGAALLERHLEFERRHSAPTVQLDALSPFDLSRVFTEPQIFDGSAECHRQFDVVVLLAPDGDFRTYAPYSRLGVWEYQFGRSSRDVPPYFEEVLKGDAFGHSMLISHDSDGDARVLYESFSGMHPHSIYKSLNPVLWKSSEFVLRSLDRLPEGGDTYRDSPHDYQRACRPGILKTLRFTATILLRYLRSKASSRVFSEQWFLAIAPRTKDTLPNASDFRTFSFEQDRSYADPSVMTVGDSEFLFYEDFTTGGERGRICVCEVYGDGSVSRPSLVLETPYHLSYPHVFRWQGKFYMIPEASENRSVDLYRAVRFPYEWKHEARLLDNIEAVDSTILAYNDELWLFANVAPAGGSTNDELHIYHSRSLFGPWQPHVHNPVISDVRSARPAGRLYCDGGKLIRPAQDCSGRYGRAIVLNEVLELSHERYKERALQRLEADWLPNSHCTHTIDRSDRFIFTDGKRYQLPWLRWPHYHPQQAYSQTMYSPTSSSNGGPVVTR